MKVEESWKSIPFKRILQILLQPIFHSRTDSPENISKVLHSTNTSEGERTFPKANSREPGWYLAAYLLTVDELQCNPALLVNEIAGMIMLHNQCISATYSTDLKPCIILWLSSA